MDLPPPFGGPHLIDYAVFLVAVGKDLRRAVDDSIRKLGIAPECLDCFEDVTMAKYERVVFAVGERKVFDMPFACTTGYLVQVTVNTSRIGKGQAKFLMHLGKMSVKVSQETTRRNVHLQS